MSQFKDLLQLIVEEVKYQHEMLKLLNEERELALKLDTRGSDKLASRKESCIIKIGRAALTRDALVREILGEKDPKKQVKASDAAQRCGVPAIRKELQNQVRALRVAIENVKVMNARNAELIGQALGVVGSSLAIIRSSPGSEAPTYGVDGNLKMSPRNPADQKRRSLAAEA
jgi:flagellar biosynthesis/type III secretory pathway chaperone